MTNVSNKAKVWVVCPIPLEVWEFGQYSYIAAVLSNDGVSDLTVPCILEGGLDGQVMKKTKKTFVPSLDVNGPEWEIDGQLILPTVTCRLDPNVAISGAIYTAGGK